MPQTQSKYPNDAEQTAWIDQAKKGDQAAFCRLVEKYQRPVYNLCYHMLRDTHNAEDAAQEVFLRAYTRLNSYDEQRQFSTWLFSIASHYCIDRLRRHRSPLVSWDDLAGWYRESNEWSSQPEQAVLEIEASAEVRHLLKTLEPDYRLVLILKYWYALSYQEIAQTLDTSVGAVKSRLFRARQMMAQAARHQQGTLLVSNRSSAAGKRAEVELGALLLPPALG